MSAIEETWDMSEEKINKIESQLEVLGKLVVVGWTLVVGAFLMGGWVAVIQLQVARNSESLNAARLDINTLALWRAETAGNRFTTQDYIRAIAPLQESTASNDKRIQRVEDAMVQVNRALDRIESKLGTK